MKDHPTAGHLDGRVLQSMSPQGTRIRRVRSSSALK